MKLSKYIIGYSWGEEKENEYYILHVPRAIVDNVDNVDNVVQKAVPFISQQDNNIRADCGGAALAMVVNYFTGSKYTVEEMTDVMGRVNQYTTTSLGGMIWAFLIMTRI